MYIVLLYLFDGGIVVKRILDNVCPHKVYFKGQASGSGALHDTPSITAMCTREDTQRAVGSR